MALFYPDCRASMSVVFDGFGPSEQNPTIVGRGGTLIPTSATVELNGYKVADTFSLTFDAKRLPFVPDLIRGALVHLWMFDTRGARFDPTVHLVDDNLEIVGVIKDARFQYSEDGRSFEMSGADLTSLLLKRKWDTSKRVPVGLPLDQTVQRLADEGTRGTRVFKVQFIDGSNLPIVGSTSKAVTSKKITVSAPKVGSGHSSTKKKGFPVATGKSYWDVIYDLCQAYGFLAFVRGYDIIISKIRVLTANAFAEVPKVAYGRNLSRLEWSRTFGTDSVPQVVVRSYDPRTRQQLVAKWPPNYRGVPSGTGTLEEKQLTYRYDGITDLGLLTDIAKDLYSDVAKGESEVSFETRSLEDLEGHDLLHLQAGQPVAIAFDAFNDALMQQLPTGERYQYLIEAGYDETVAALVSGEYDRIRQFDRPFYTKTITKRWQTGGGISLSVVGLNFVSVRRDDV